MRHILHDWRTKTQPGTPVNWQHPLTRGLVGAWLLNEGGGTTVRNLATNPILGSLDANVSWAPSQGGLGVKNNATYTGVNLGNATAFQSTTAVTAEILYV